MNEIEPVEQYFQEIKAKAQLAESELGDKADVAAFDRKMKVAEEAIATAEKERMPLSDELQAWGNYFAQQEEQE